MDSTDLDSQATNNSTFQNFQQKPSNIGNTTFGDGQNTIVNPIMVKASKNSPSQDLQPSVNFSIFDVNTNKVKTLNPVQGVKRQRKASASQRQTNTIEKYLVNHN